MLKQLKEVIRGQWQRIKEKIDFEHLGLRISSYTKFCVGITGVMLFGFFVLMEIAYYPIMMVELRMAVVEDGDAMGSLFRVWPILSFVFASMVYIGGLCWSVAELGASFSCYDSYYRRIIELRARINDAEAGIEGNGRGSEWLWSLEFEDEREARKVANFVFQGKKLGLNVKRLVENKFRDE